LAIIQLHDKSQLDHLCKQTVNGAVGQASSLGQGGQWCTTPSSSGQQTQQGHTSGQWTLMCEIDCGGEQRSFYFH
jgi:hypothetical protein